MKGLVLDGIPIPQMRPDRAGVVFYLMPNTVWGTVLAAAEAAANGLDQPMARYMIRRLSEEGLVLQIGRHKRSLGGPPDKLRAATAAGQALIEKRGADCPIVRQP